jgi:hypothetical protein
LERQAVKVTAVEDESEKKNHAKAKAKEDEREFQVKDEVRKQERSAKKAQMGSENKTR